MSIPRDFHKRSQQNNVNDIKIDIIMIAPKIDFSDREERIAFIKDRFSCKAPACGGCGSCNMPNGKSAMETFSDYIEGKKEFVTIASELWNTK